MIFSSLIFLYVFLPLTLILYYFLPKKFRNFLILIASLVFYGWGEPTYIFLMLISIFIEYIGAIYIEKFRKNKEKSRAILITVLVINVCALFFFKYYVFLIDNINLIFNIDLKIKQLPLPLGISFYTFQLMSYVIDVYKNEIKVQKNFINFAAYVTMFPQLVAGPIVQYSTIEKQLTCRKETIEKFGIGVERFVIGLGKKVIIANNMGLIWNEVNKIPSNEISILTSWLGIIAFTLQIYFDFSGYSDMAIGIGKMMGFSFMENFNYPYISKSITEFWRRWHISLGTWFRDYIYIPLGGNRKGTLIQIRNIFVVWFVTGLWHGASWNFVIWGVYFGVIIFIEKIGFNKILNKLPGIFCNIYTMILVTISWVFFDTKTLNEALIYIAGMFGLNNNNISDNISWYLLNTNLKFYILALICATPILKKIINTLKKKNIGRIVVIIVYVLIIFISTAYLVSESYNPFLYFRF